MQSLLNACLILFSLVLVSCVVVVSADDVDDWQRGTHSLNRSIELPAHSQEDEVATVNGKIRIGAFSQVRSVSSVNGSVFIGRHSQIRRLESVNGDVELAEDAVVIAGIDAINGEVSLAPGAQIQATVSLINGRLKARRATILGAVETVNADIELLEGSRVEGGLQVRSGKGVRSATPLRILLGPDSVIAGESVFERPVRIYQHASARLGDYTGEDVSIRPWEQR